MNTISEDGKIMLLLGVRAGAETAAAPLDLRAFNLLLPWLQANNLTPAGLLSSETVHAAARGTGLESSRLIALLGRHAELEPALEVWTRSGLWIVWRGDAAYPSRLHTHLKEKAPPLLFGAGDPTLLKGGGLAIVGSRNVDADGEAFARAASGWCARGGLPVVSGGARGVDQIAMSSALEEGGTVLGVLADTLLKKSLSPETREALSEGRLLLMSPFHPEAGFDVGNAMGRNKLIYAMADYGLVVSAEYGKGGTWQGAEEELKRKPHRPVFVRLDETAPPGNRKLSELGARPFPPLSETAPQSALDAASPKNRCYPVEQDLPLFPVKAMERKGT